ncbi:AsmA-like C-terminal domain-containing protein [Campylobacter sp. faydin G-24]|uniref:AsmA-like C-terminal domain-containing protein n=1 Tax=Campylobacter anatolicus TaxID=2829105 RepID=A0ABS5HI91_9BACT|nr:AsmA-like C-terminal domain-containing protein [Campylobacter anatolicus]MBR8463968.1 AsmA-like C-terminal domain-containing protein [Campylobacter anatolicus]
MSKKIAKYGLFIKFFIIFILSFIILLKFGIKIADFNVGGVDLEQLYIKLDKKLIFRADRIKLPNLKPNENEKKSSKYLLSITDSVMWLDRLFEEISLKSVIIGENKLKVFYKDDIFFVDSAFFGADIRVQKHSEDNTDVFEIKNISFKDFNVSIAGLASANLKQKKYAFSGTFSSHEINGNIDAALIDDTIRYKAYDIRANSLRNFMDELDYKFGINKDVKNWVYGYIIAQDYSINELNGKVNLKSADFFLNELNATGIAKDLKVKFASSLEAVDVKQANVELKDGKLYFKLINPTYKGRQLNGSNLVIYDIFNEKTAGLLLNLKTSAIYDSAINDILKAYDISVPVSQTSGKMDASLSLDIKFDPFLVTANGVFLPRDAMLEIVGAKFKTESAEIKLINSNLLRINAKNFGMDFFDSDAIAVIDLDKKSGDINGTLKSLNLITDDKKLLSLKNQDIYAKLDFSSKDTKLDLLNLGINLSFGKENFIHLLNAKDLITHSPLLSEIGIKSMQDISIKTKDFANLSIEAKNVEFDLPFYKKDKTPYDIDDFSILVTPNGTSGKTANGLVNFNANNKSVDISVRDLDLVVDTNSTSQDTKQAINLHGKNSDIILSDLNRTLPFKNYEVQQNSKSLIVSGMPENGRFELIKNDKDINIDARDISGDFVNKLFNIQSFEGGKFRLKLVGVRDDFKGEVRCHDTFLKDYIFYQKLLSFLNSIPSLISLKTPDFNDKGFSVKTGKILFEKKGEVLHLIAVELIGTSADIGGVGTIDFKTKQINIDLELKILKDASNIIDKIPLLNQIILGKDRSLSTLIKIRGTIDKPEYSTQVLQDAFLSPFKIIRNILEAPFLIFD